MVEGERPAVAHGANPAEIVAAQRTGAADRGGGEHVGRGRGLGTARGYPRQYRGGAQIPPRLASRPPAQVAVRGLWML
jgi:hypothetical protein